MVRPLRTMRIVTSHWAKVEQKFISIILEVLIDLLVVLIDLIHPARVEAAEGIPRPTGVLYRHAFCDAYTDQEPGGAFTIRPVRTRVKLPVEALDLPLACTKPEMGDHTSVAGFAVELSERAEAVQHLHEIAHRTVLVSAHHLTQFDPICDCVIPRAGLDRLFWEMTPRGPAFPKATQLRLVGDRGDGGRQRLAIHAAADDEFDERHGVLRRPHIIQRLDSARRADFRRQHSQNAQPSQIDEGQLVDRLNDPGMERRGKRACENRVEALVVRL